MGRPAKALSGDEPVRGFKSHPLRQMKKKFARLCVVFLLVALILGVKPVGATSVMATTECRKYFQARPGDSWSRIAARFSLSQTKLLALNGAKNSTKILIGDRLCLRTREIKATVVSEQAKPIQTHTGNEVVAIIREIWPDEFEELALLVARRESNLKPNVVGGTNGCCVGLFQIYFSVHRVWLATIGVTESSQLLDARVNTEAAYKMFKRNGESWKPWWTKSWRP